ncbi:unnamed protein product, partial [Symbiodinium sp. CCMP2592]
EQDGKGGGKSQQQAAATDQSQDGKAAGKPQEQDGKGGGKSQQQAAATDQSQDGKAAGNPQEQDGKGGGKSQQQAAAADQGKSQQPASTYDPAQWVDFGKAGTAGKHPAHERKVWWDAQKEQQQSRAAEKEKKPVAKASNGLAQAPPSDWAKQQWAVIRRMFYEAPAVADVLLRLGVDGAAFNAVLNVQLHPSPRGKAYVAELCDKLVKEDNEIDNPSSYLMRWQQEKTRLLSWQESGSWDEAESKYLCHS